MKRADKVLLVLQILNAVAQCAAIGALAYLAYRVTP